MQTDELEFQRELELLRKDGLKDNPLRKEYEAKVSELAKLAQELLSQGVSEKEAARVLHKKRRELGVKYKHAAPPLLQQYIYYATAKKYGDPLGPSFEELCKKKSYAEIIASSSRPIADLDKRLTVEGFREWFEKEKKIKTNLIHEHCNNCDNEVVMEWNTAKHGFIAYCPFCGARLFLCSVCPHSQSGDNSCDWKCDFNGNEECMYSRNILSK